MSKAVVAALLLALLPVPVQAQPSAIYAETIVVNTPAHVWSQQQSDYAIAQVNDALGWWQARPLGTARPLEFVVGSPVIVSVAYEPTQMSAAETVELLESVVLGRDTLAYADALARGHGTDAAFTIFLIGGQSPYWVGFAPASSVVVTYAPQMYLASTVAHEIGHVLGAGDHYADPACIMGDPFPAYYAGQLSSAASVEMGWGPRLSLYVPSVLLRARTCDLWAMEGCSE